MPVARGRLQVERGSLAKGRPPRFHAPVAFYPSCRERQGVMTATLNLIGDKDARRRAVWLTEKER